jgi:hypothetical protein
VIQNQFRVYIESAKTRAIASAVDWPGWCRVGRSESDALGNLLFYAHRYRQALEGSSLDFRPPSSIEELMVFERLQGKSGTDYGVPEVILESDLLPVEPVELERWKAVLTASWQAFDSAVEAGGGRTLRKGPRGGGRDLDKIVAHVREAERGYVGVLGGKLPQDLPGEPERRGAVLAELASAVRGELPKFGPRGGKRWPPRYFVRRFAWHLLDHAWEIEDRIE